MSLTYPILVVSYNEENRAALEASLRQQQVAAVSCATFVEAEDWARQGIFNGMLVDLTSIIKAKGEEKIIACSLTGFYPTLRVRATSSTPVPMTTSGTGRQARKLKDFLESACATFNPRRIRAHRRHEVCVAALLYEGEKQSLTFTLDLSWGGAFFMDVHAERFSVGDRLTIRLPEFDVTFSVVVRWVQPWGGRRVPGIGCQFLALDAQLEGVLGILLKNSQDLDRDRMLA